MPLACASAIRLTVCPNNRIRYTTENVHVPEVVELSGTGNRKLRELELFGWADLGSEVKYEPMPKIRISEEFLFLRNLGYFLSQAMHRSMCARAITEISAEWEKFVRTHASTFPDYGT